MDLVSITLDKYLKHRFNGSAQPVRHAAHEASQPNSVAPQNSSSTPVTRQDNVNSQTSANDDEPVLKSAIPEMTDIFSDICEPDIAVHTLSFGRLVPCCVSIHHELTHIAAGFENSQIYLWAVISDKSRSEPIENQNNFPKDSAQATVEPSIAKTHHDAQSESQTGSSKLRLGDMSRLTAHSGTVYSIEFVQDNDLMLSSSEDTTIRLWCLKSKCNLLVYRGHSYPIWSITLSPRGDYFASASMDTTARLWSFDKQCPLRLFCGHEDDVECVKFHPNAKYIATGSADTTIRLWNISDGRMVRLMVGHQSAITSLSFYPDGKFLASSSDDGSVKVWNLATNSITKNLIVPAFCAISFSPSQEFASTCGKDNILRIWRLGDPSIVEKITHDLGDKFTKMILSHFLTDNKLFIVGLTKPSIEAHSTDDEIPMAH